MSTKKIKAKRMWADHPNAAMFKVIKIRCYGCDHRILIFPNTAEAYDQMVEQGAKRLLKTHYPGANWSDWVGGSIIAVCLNDAKVVLASLGVTRPEEGKK